MPLEASGACGVGVGVTPSASPDLRWSGAREFEDERQVEANGDHLQEEGDRGVECAMPSVPQAEMSPSGQADTWPTVHVSIGAPQGTHQSPLASDRGEAYAHTVAVTHHDSVRSPAAAADAGVQPDTSDAREIHGPHTGQRSGGHTRHRAPDQPGFLAQHLQQEEADESSGQGAITDAPTGIRSARASIRATKGESMRKAAPEPTSRARDRTMDGVISVECTGTA